MSNSERGVAFSAEGYLWKTEFYQFILPPPKESLGGGGKKFLGGGICPPQDTQTTSLKFDRRDVNPFRIQDEIQEITGEKVKEITGMNKFKLTLQTTSAEQTSKCLKISSLAGKICKIGLHPKFNTGKGLIFLRQFETDDTDEFKTNLHEQYDV